WHLAVHVLRQPFGFDDGIEYGLIPACIAAAFGQLVAGDEAVGRGLDSYFGSRIGSDVVGEDDVRPDARAYAAGVIGRRACGLLRLARVGWPARGFGLAHHAADVFLTQPLAFLGRCLLALL